MNLLAPQFVVAIRCDTHTSTLKPLQAGLHTPKKVATSAGSDPGENPGTGAAARVHHGAGAVGRVAADQDRAVDALVKVARSERLRVVGE
jgi:hypothetical protein